MTEERYEQLLGMHKKWILQNLKETYRLLLNCNVTDFMIKSLCIPYRISEEEMRKFCEIRGAKAQAAMFRQMMENPNF